MIFSNVSLRSLRRFAVTFTPMLLLEISSVTPWTACSMMIGYIGDSKGVASYGLYNFFVNIVIAPFMSSILEVGGTFYAKKFGEKDWRGLIAYFWKTCLLTVPFLAAFSVVAYNSSSILTGIGVDKEVADRTARLIYWSIITFPFSYLTSIIQAYMLSQNIQNEFNVQSALSVPLLILAAKIFILDLEMNEFGTVPTCIVQDCFAACFTLVIAFRSMDRRAIGMSSWKEITTDFWFFSTKSMISSIGIFVDFLTYEFNTFMVTQLHNVDQLAVYVAWTSFYLVPYHIICAVSVAIRTNSGQMLGSGNHRGAKREAIAYFMYTAVVICSIAVGFAVYAPTIAKLFLDSPELVPDVTKTIYVTALLLFFSTGLYPTIAVLRLLNLDFYFMKMTVIVYFVLNGALSGVLCFWFDMGAVGVVIGHEVSATIMILVFFHKIFVEFDWSSVTELQDQILESIELRSRSHP